MSKLRSCCVPCCKDEKFSLVHKFPADNERAEQWRRALGIDSFIGLPIDIIRKRFYICSRHFRDSDYKNKASRSINITAVPSINLVTLNDPEGLNRDLPPPYRPGTIPVGQSVEVQEEQRSATEAVHPIVIKTIEQPANTSNTVSIDELHEFIEETYTEDPLTSPENERTLYKAPRLDVPSTNGSLKRANPRPSTSAGESRTIGIDFEPKAKVPVTNSNNVMRVSIITKPAVSVVPAAGPVSPAGMGSLVLKRVKGPAMMVERKKCSLASTMTQTDDTVETDKPRSGQADGVQEGEEAKATTSSSTKVLALLEVTPDNLQRLQRKLQNEGGTLCLDERLLQLDDEDEHADSDKAMKPDRTDGTADTSRFLTIRDNETDEPVSVSYVWLRDHCRCEECYNVATFQRSTSILDLPLDIEPATCEVCNEKINIVWQDGHRSTYQLSFVLENHVDRFRKREEARRAQLVLWDRELISSSASSYARVTLNDLLCEDSVMRQVVGSLITYGFAFITKVPPNQQSTEMAVKRIFPVQRTLFGDMWTFSESKMDHSDTAYTNGFLGPHTDNTYFSDAAGLQVLHCIQFNGKGGETLLVDGFRAVERLRENDPAAYERLCEYPLEAEYIEEDKHHRYVAPVIKRHRVLSDTVEQIRFNPYDRAPMRTVAPGDVPQFYADYRQLAEELYREEAQWKFQLTPGTVLIFDNWRVLHGRMAYSGKRVMTGCYVARTEYQSVARTMGLVE
uniref:Trimethyllysine dioxygenase, mitochondrial n=1 Tax=Anopheles epiroticus TaxID=199890 RepID=A0A182P3E3_9DIPT